MTDHHASLDRALARTRPDEHAAQIVHRILCIRYRMDWHCGGLSEDDFGEAGRIADLLVGVRAEALRVARQVERDMSEQAADAWRSADARRGLSDHDALLVHADALTRWSERFRMAFEGNYYAAEVTPDA